MLDNTVFLFSVTQPDGVVMDAYRQDERDSESEIGKFIYLVICTPPHGHPFICIYPTYEGMLHFITRELLEVNIIDIAIDADYDDK